MSFPAVADPDLPDHGGDACSYIETYGYHAELYECRSENGLYYRLVVAGTGIEFDIHPDRILLQHGSVKMEVRADKIVSHAPLLEHHGDVAVTGNIHASGVISADEDVLGGGVGISLVSHRHGFSGGTGVVGEPT